MEQTDDLTPQTPEASDAERDAATPEQPEEAVLDEAEAAGAAEAGEGDADAPTELEPADADADFAEPDPAELDPDRLRLVEALLFAAEAPLDEAALRERLPPGSDVAALIAELETLYRGRGVIVQRVAHGWTLRTAPDLAPRLNLERKVTRKLSRAATETLAIIAYHQPVTRAEIEEIRGVVISKGTLDVLMETGWIEPKGRRQTVGRPVTWVTTEVFLVHFSLADLADLPGVEELRAAGLIGRTVTTLSEQAAQLPPLDQPGDDTETEDEREAAAELRPEPTAEAEEERVEQESAEAARPAEPDSEEEESPPRESLSRRPDRARRSAPDETGEPIDEPEDAEIEVVAAEGEGRPVIEA